MIDLGGVIIEVKDLEVIVHHGGYQDPHELVMRRHYEPITVGWEYIPGADGDGRGKIIVDLTGYACRAMMVIEAGRYLNLLATPIWTTDGKLTIDWTQHQQQPEKIEVVHG